MRQGYNYIKRLNYVLLDALKLSYNFWNENVVRTNPLAKFLELLRQNAAELGSVHFMGEL